MRSPKAQTLFEVGISHYRDKDFPAAISFFEKAIQENPNDPEGEMFLGLSYLGILKKDQAERILVNACPKKKMWASCWNNLAYVYIRNQKYSSALEAADKALKVDTFRDPQLAYTNKGRAQHELGQYSDALKSLLAAKSLEPDSCLIRLHLGRTYFKLGDTLQGNLEIQFALSKCPQDPIAHLWEAYSIYQKKNFKGTLRKLEYIRQRFPKGLAMETATRFTTLVEEKVPLPEPPLE